MDIWEATVTFIWFPIMVIIAWRLDKHESKLIAARKITVQDASEDLEFSDGTKSHFEDKTVAAFLKEECKCEQDGTSKVGAISKAQKAQI